MTKISVVVSLRDCGERIIEALESISAQTYPHDNVETIVVDHGSTDMSPALARRFMARRGMQGSVLLIDGDIWAAFDAGWHQANGEWVQFLKGQDLLAPAHLEVLAKAVSEADEVVQVACSSWQCLYASGNAGPVYQAGIGAGNILQLVSPHTWTLGAALFRKSAIADVSGFGVGMSFATAERLMLRIAGVGERICLRRRPFLDVPSSSPMFFENSDSSPDSNRAASVEEHLENILLARLALIEDANGDIAAADTEVLTALCEESLRDLLDHDRRAFVRCYQRLYDVDPRLVSAAAIAAPAATTSSGTVIAERFALTIPSWRQAQPGRSERALVALRNPPAARPRFPTKSALIATAVVAGIAVVLLGTRLTTTLIATALDGKPELVVEKPNAVAPKINVASANYVELGSPWPMPIEIAPASAVPSSSVLHLHGLPPTITLSEGSRVSSDTWVVPVASLPNLDLLAADGAKGKSEISLFLVGNDGQVLAEARSAILIAGEPPAPTVAVAQEVARTAAAPTSVTPAAPPAQGSREAINPAGMQEASAEKATAPAKPERPNAAGQSPRAGRPVVIAGRADQATKQTVAREAARKVAEAKKAEDEREAAEAARKAEEARRVAEAKAAEEARNAEAARKAAEAKKAEEEREAAEAARKAEEARRLAEAKAAEEARKVEAARKVATAQAAAPSGAGEQRGAQVAGKESEQDAPRPSSGSQHSPEASVKPEPTLAAIPDRPSGATAVTASAAALSADQERLAKMIVRGEHELEVGNVSIARQFFLRAADGGLARGALLLAWTYDKNEYARLRIQGVTPNRELADKWYERARELEVTDKTGVR